jgi:protease-4
LQLEGAIVDANKGFFDRSPGVSMPQLTQSLQKAALDPRVAGIAIEIEPLAVGYAKLMEIRRWVELN